ncbi:MAG: hypothetical protein HKN92_00245 [Chitinophagales bacterium]|nr:hypothetical protein [Chitinophagales bacterium]
MNSQSAQNLPEFKFDPFLQALIIAVLSASILLISSFTTSSDSFNWSVACTAVLFFAMVNPILSVFQLKWGTYFVKSVISLAMISALVVFICSRVTGASILNEKAFAMTMLASLIFFFMASVLALLVKKIYSFATESL